MNATTDTEMETEMETALTVGLSVALSPKQAAERMNVGESMMWKLIQRRHIGTFRVGKRTLKAGPTLKTVPARGALPHKCPKPPTYEAGSRFAPYVD
jgi:excisionase family DNA binding protein